VHVVRLADGKALCDIASATPLIPASNQKIVTSAVAIRRLGEGFTFRTVLAMEGDDLVVIGDGDPTTGDARLAARRGESIYAAMDRWVVALKAAGVKSIKGNLIVRAGIFGGANVHPDWPKAQLRQYYAAPASGMNFNDNCLDIGFTVTGKRVQPILRPVSRYIRLASRVTRGKRHLWDCRFDRTGTAGAESADAVRVRAGRAAGAGGDQPGRKAGRVG
ncbi:hypothetical protein LCGC14_3142980, partial [marine sediment metagenome]